jgi:DNA-binding GntR family transcriptional regulator
MSGELPAGARLRVRDLALQVGTSVMPVREAIRRLEEAGLAERVPHKGAVVKGLTLTELEHVYDVRILLETEAAGLGGAVVTPEGCARMWQLCDDIARAVAAGQIVDALNHDEALLTILYSAGGNPVLLEMVRGLWQRCRPYKIVGARRALDASDGTLWTFQPRIVEAARDHDGGATAAITRESLLSAKARIEETLGASATASRE